MQDGTRGRRGSSTWDVPRPRAGGRPRDPGPGDGAVQRGAGGHRALRGRLRGRAASRRRGGPEPASAPAAGGGAGCGPRARPGGVPGAAGAFGARGAVPGTVRGGARRGGRRGSPGSGSRTVGCHGCRERIGVSEAAPRATPAQRAALAALRGYQAARAGHVSPCRFYPSCSAYAVEAVERHGAVRGMWLAARRVGRCRPFGGSGVDLVPLEVRRGRRRPRRSRG